MTDDIYWVIAEENGVKSFFFCIDEDPRTITEGCVTGKMIYTEAEPYGHQSVPYQTREYGTLFRTVRKNVDGMPFLLDEIAIQQVTEDLGYQAASGLQKNISQIKVSQIVDVFSSELFLEKFSSSDAIKFARQVASHYDIDCQALRLSGGALINGKNLYDQHDLDVVIPIVDSEHAKKLWDVMRSKDSGHLIENGFKSPMRWMCDEAHMVCPFFVYGDSMEHPITSVKQIGWYAGNLVVSDSRYSIFNMPILLTTGGGVEFIAFRSRVARACLSEGETLDVDGELVEVIEGELKGKQGVLIAKPFEEVKNLKYLMRRWNA